MRRPCWAMLALILIGVLGAGPAWAGTPAAGHVRLAIASAAHQADYSQSPARDSYVILNEWERSKMLALKAANPSLKVLLYQNLSALAARDASGNVNTGVTTQEADPSWYLLNTSGQRFTFWGYDWMYAADVGNAAYQQRWADNVLAKLRSGGWDGVFMDDTNPTIKYHYEPSRVAKYPTDARYGAATGSAVAAIGPRIRAAGKLVIPNFGAWREYRSVVDGWLPFVDGGMEEMLTKWSADPGQGYLTGADWDLQLGEIKTAEAAGKVFLGITHGTATDAAAARYGWGTVLLAAQGRSSFALADDYASQRWFPEYDYDLGGALGAEAAESTGVHRRAFARGLVLVNPTNGTVAAGFGGLYSGSGLSGATQATMGPHSALVLTADAGTTPTPPPVATPTPTPTPVAPAPPPVATPTPVAPAPTPAAPAPTPTVTKPPAKPATPKRKRRTRVSARTAALRAAGSITARVRCRKGGASCRRTVRVLLPRHGAPLVTGHRTVTVAAGHSRRVTVKLSAAGRQALAHGGSLLVRVR